MQQAQQLTAHKGFDSPDEVREFPQGKGEILMIGGGEVGRYTVQPGWRWSEHVKPVAGRSSRGTPLPVPRGGHDRHPHGRRHRGRGRPRRDQRARARATTPGSIGDEPVVLVDWGGAHTWAKHV